MATHLVWDHEWQIRALPPRPNNATVAESGRRLRLKI